MKINNKKRIGNIIFLLIAILFLVSCKQIFLIQEVVHASQPSVSVSSWGGFCTLVDGSFFVSFAIFISIAILLWYKGFFLLEWFIHRHMSSRITIILVVSAIVFSICSIPIRRHGVWFALPITMAIGSFIILVLSLFKRFKNRWSGNVNKNPMPEDYRHQRNLQLLAIMMIWIWSCGWVLYFVVIEIANNPHLGTELLFRSALCSLMLFAGNVDSTLLSEVGNYELLKGLISCVGLAAIVCTATLILNLVLSRVMAYLHLKHIQISDERNHLYLFFGLNDASKLLADSIYDRDSQSVVIYVENNIVDKLRQEENTEGWKSIVSMFSFRRKVFSDIPKDSRHSLALANCDVCSLEKETTDVLGNIGLTVIKRLLNKLVNVQKGELHVFFLSEDKDTNARATCILAKDEMINNPNFQTVIYCHARRNGVNRIIEDLGLKEELNTIVKILDSSYLAMESLKRDVKNHPVSFVNIKTLHDDNPGTVSSPFVSLIMGFGETGQEAVKFLYEYGAFVNEKATAHHSFRSPFVCHIVDKEMKTLEGPFMADIPGVNCKKSTQEGEQLINFYSYDYRSDEFFTKVLAPIADTLNYVVVAIGDDELNMTVAVEILRYVRKRRNNLDNFCIYVRAYEKGTFKYLNDIAKHYNLRLRKDENDNISKIILFGQNEQIYTYDLVVKDKYQEEAKQYYDTYRKLQLDPDNDKLTWEERHNNTMNNKKITKWERMSKIKRKESQDRSNALHAQTKMLILEKAVGTENMKDFAHKALGQRTKKGFNIVYPQLLDAENRLMLNLAMCEHLRWNAAHEMLGYVNNTSDNHGCDELKRSHNCLKPWQELDKESQAVTYIDNYKLFDFGVVETTFKLEYQI